MSSKESVNMAGIVCRCTNPNHKDFEFYGGRNIKVYPLWLTNRQAFIDYLKTLEHYGEEGYSLDRIDNNKGYEPGNLRFTTAKTQARNRSNNIYAHYYGQRMLLIDIAGLTGIEYNTLRQRYHKGLDNEDLIKPVKKRLPKSDLIVVENNQALATSVIIAEKFGKDHRNVLRDIRKLIDDLAQIGVCSNLSTPPASDNSEQIGVSPNLGTPPASADSELSKLSSLPVFIESTYINQQNGQTYPQFLMNRNGFTLLAMGFTGTKALEWKLKYIDAFNRMELALKGKSDAPKKSAPKTEKLPFDKKIDLLKYLVEQSPTDDVKIKYLEQIAEMVY